MSTKKRFSISADLASGIRNTIQSASSNQGQLHYDMMSVADIEPDPENPRRLWLSTHEMLYGVEPTDVNYQEKHHELSALNELAASIKRIGIRNAIEVYKEGAKYRIISGERRYRAAQLSGLRSVPVRISSKPDDFHLRYTQWVENINREDLSLWEKFNNLSAMADAYRKANKDDFDEQTLQTILGVSHTQAYRYLNLLKADKKILSLIESGKLNNLKTVQELVSMKDKGGQSQIISWMLTSKQEITSIKPYLLTAGKKASLGKPNKTKGINLGKAPNSYVARELHKILCTDPRLSAHRQRFDRIDWSSPKAISKAFKDIFKTIEKELSIEEIA